jgi:ABC-type amino acid transport substrate-binding protein
MQLERNTHAPWREGRIAFAVAFLALFAAPAAQAQDEPAAETAAAAPAPTTTLERVRSSGRLALGYVADAQPFSYRDASGSAAGYAVAVCRSVVEQVKAELGMPGLTVDWILVTAADRLAAVERGEIDLLCTGEAVTLTARETVAFSVPIFENGLGALMHAAGSERLRAALEERPPPYQPLWRGSAVDALQQRTIAVVAGTPAASALEGRIRQFGPIATVSTVSDYSTGVARVLDGSADAFFGDRALLLDAARQSTSPDDLVVLSRYYRFQPVALALARGDEDFRLAVDRALSQVYASADFGTTYADAFGEPDPDTVHFFRLTALPE